MKKFLDEKFSMNQNGLFLCELPTGFGKTYISAQKICEYVLNSKSDRRIIFLTTLKKNLPEDDLISFFGSRKLYNEKVLRIRSNFEEVTQKIPELEIPDEFCNDCYNNLFNAVKAYNTAVKNGVRDKKYIEHLKEEVEKTDRSFRNYITEILKHNFLNKEQRLEAVRNDPLYTWIGKLYPAVFTDDYRVLLMSMDKFLAKNSVLVEPSYDFLKADFISNSIIFIDEFDAAKDTVKRKIIERSLGMKNDFLVLFRQIQRTINSDYPAKTLTELLREITDEEEISMICVNRINSMSVNKYFNYRYCNIFRAMLSFCRTRNIKSMLYLGMALPKKNNPEFDEELLRDLFEYANTASGAKLNADSLFVLRGDGFDEDKETLLNRLSNGEKIFIMSSYKTLGAGQNLQYPINDTSGFISLRECENERDNRFSSKDIDAIYLADITNLTSNTYTSRNFGETDLMNMLFQVEELYNNGELNFREKTNMIKLAFNSYSNVREHGIFPNILYEMPSIKMQASKDVIQACGRLCRTFVKNSDIYIFAEEKLLEKISPSEMRKRILPPEIEAVAQMSESLGKEYTYNENKILNLAETISTKGTYTIMSVLTKKWTSVSMTMWQQLREYALRYPTVSKEFRDSSRDLQKLYITSGAPQNSYLYSQYSDFSDVVIDFSNDVISFRNSGRAKQKGNTDEVAVYKMNEEESGLPIALKYNGMSDYFTSNGYALGFEPNDYMMSPVLFHNIYKGALGEFAGEFILRQERGIVLKPITDSDRFEVFDFEMNDGIYVDFKNWKFTYLKDREKVKEHILNKLDEIGGKRAYVIQLVGHKDFNPSISEDERIVEIPGLIDENGTPIFKNINMIKEEDYIAADK